jgi:hypothetical protein
MFKEIQRRHSRRVHPRSRRHHHLYTRSPPKKTASTKADLAYRNPNIGLLLLEHAEETNIMLPECRTELWSRWEVRKVCVLLGLVC